MRAFLIGLVVVVITGTALAACGGADKGAPQETVLTSTTTLLTSTTEAAPTTEATTTSAVSTSTSEASTTSASLAEDADNSGWKTIATLRSTDETWKNLPGVLMTNPFEVHGEAQLVLDMPDAGELDGVIAAIVKEAGVSDLPSLIDAVRDGIAVTMLPRWPTKEITGLDGTYVLVNTVPAETAWTLELQIPR